ncbi:MAG: GspE/PulE family protein [Saprospiraceae bacterium]
MLDQEIPTAILQQITTQQAWHYTILPYQFSGKRLALYVSEENLKPSLSEELEVLLGYHIDLTPVATDSLKEALSKYYRKPKDSRTKSQNIDTSLKDSKNILLVLVQEAKNLGSSDIHFEPYEEKARIRMRIDGVLIERYILKKADYPSLTNKIKIQANLDIAEKRLPQDGRIFLQDANQKQLDIRVSVMPTLHGEKIVLRLLSNEAIQVELSGLGFNDNDLAAYTAGIERPNGIILISGPTGSGKTTTLYATLKLLNSTTKNIVTIEDPIEYTLEGINQVQLKENIGLDFPSAMRTFLRQDPNIIMVGEIRDKATAAMAIRASLTGHIVLSTIHTNSAWGIIARLVDMGIPAYLLADTLNTAVAQRLVRLLCKTCKKAESFDPQLLPKHYKLPSPIIQHYVPNGCENCFYTGYWGRQAIYEVITIDSELATEIKQENFNVKTMLENKGVKDLADNAFQIFKAGLTSLAEIYPILASK